MRSNKLLLSFAFFTCLTCFFLSASEVDLSHLRYHLKKGDAYEIHSTTWFHNYVDDVQPKKQTTTHSTEFRMKVLDVDKEGNTTARIIYDRISVARIPDVFEGQVLEKVANSVVGQPFQLVFSPTGEIKEVIGHAELQNHIEAELLKLSPNDKQQNDGYVKWVYSVCSQWSENALKQKFQSFLGYFPREPVSKEGFWKNIYPLDHLGIAITKTFQLPSLENLSLITFASKISCNKSADNDFKRNGSGVLVIDLDTGWCLEKNYSETLKGTLTVIKNNQKRKVAVTQRQVQTLVSTRLW